MPVRRRMQLFWQTTPKYVLEEVLPLSCDTIRPRASAFARLTKATTYRLLDALPERVTFVCHFRIALAPPLARNCRRIRRRVSSRDGQADGRTGREQGRVSNYKIPKRSASQSSLSFVLADVPKPRSVGLGAAAASAHRKQRKASRLNRYPASDEANGRIPSAELRGQGGTARLRRQPP